MKNIKKIFALLLSLCLIFCLCACKKTDVDYDDSNKELLTNDEQLLNEIMTAPIETGAGGGVAGEFAPWYEKFMYSWDEYLEHIASDEFVNTRSQQYFWKLKDKVKDLFHYSDACDIHLQDDYIGVKVEENSPCLISYIGVFYIGGRDFLLYNPSILADYPMHTDFTEETVKSLGWSYAKVTLNGREYLFQVKDGEVIEVKFILDGKYEVYIRFNSNYIPSIENMSVSLGDMKIAAPVTVDEKIAFATAFADMVTSELTVVTPPPAVTE